MRIDLQGLGFEGGVQGRQGRFGEISQEGGGGGGYVNF